MIGFRQQEPDNWQWQKMGQLSDRTNSKGDKGPWGPMVNSFIP